MADFELATLQYKAEIIGYVCNALQARLKGPAQLEVKMHAGRDLYKQVPLSGDEQFRCAGATLGEVRGLQMLKLHLAPVRREEYAYAIVLEKDFSNFTWKCQNQTAWGAFSVAFEHLLHYKHKSGMTYRDMLAAVTTHAKQKYLAEQIESHKEFASW